MFRTSELYQITDATVSIETKFDYFFEKVKVQKIIFNLELTGLLSHFENRIFSCYTINKWKPDPAVFLWAADIMKFKPKDCVIIEDSLTGVKAAKNGGFDVFGFTAHDYHNELEKEATLTFNAMAELDNLLR